MAPTQLRRACYPTQRLLNDLARELSRKSPLLSHGKILSAAKGGSDHSRYSNIKCPALGVHST